MVNSKGEVKMSKPYSEILCKGCERKFRRTDAGGRDKWLCFGVTTRKGREKHTIPEFDNLRLCIKHQKPLKKLPVKNLCQLNITEIEAKVLITGLTQLLKS